jgi:peptidyl-prolyl cis-trans isomerase C
MSLSLPFAHPLRLLALAGCITFGAAEAAAQQRGQSSDSVVARVDGHEIYASDVQDALSQLPPEYMNMPAEQLFRAVIEQLIDRQLVVRRARDQKLERDLDVQKTMKQLEARVLEQVYLRRMVEKKITDEAVARRYERDKAQLVREKKVRARHILVKTRDEAIAIMREISRGKDFAAMAKEKSIGPSGPQGGDLGFFTREQMVPVFSQMAFSLKKGEVARAPVQTQYGWHLIKVEDIQEAAPPTLAEVKDELRAKMGEELIEGEIKRLREGAKVERFGMDGKPLPPGEQAPAAGGR